MMTNLDLSIAKITAIEVAARLYRIKHELEELEDILVPLDPGSQLERILDWLEDYRCALLGLKKT